MTRLCLDTSAYSNFKRGHEDTVRAIATADWIGIPTIVLGELRCGFRLGSRPEDNEAELRELLASDLVEVLAVDDAASHVYAEMVVALRRAGTAVPTNDLWIAALAARAGATVLTHDRHFAAIPGTLARIL